MLKQPRKTSGEIAIEAIFLSAFFLGVLLVFQTPWPFVVAGPLLFLYVEYAIESWRNRKRA